MIHARMFDLPSRALTSIVNYNEIRMPNVTKITASAREHIGHRAARSCNLQRDYRAANREVFMTRTAAVLTALLVMISAGFAEDAPKKQPFIIGDARMTSDGTIIVNLRRTTDGINVSGVVRYPVNDPHYQEVLDHLGGMIPGETKLVPAWDDPGVEKK
jgi:hypothetical protein